MFATTMHSWSLKSEDLLYVYYGTQVQCILTIQTSFVYPLNSPNSDFYVWGLTLGLFPKAHGTDDGVFVQSLLSCSAN